MNDGEFAEFASAKWRKLTRTAVLLGCQLSDAEDLVQDTLVRCYLNWDKVKGANNPDAYLSRMLVNGFRSARRKRRYLEVAVAEPPDPGQPDFSDAVDESERALAALSGLRREVREVLVLRFYADLSVDEIATVLRTPTGTVKSRISRAMKELERLPMLHTLETEVRHEGH